MADFKNNPKKTVRFNPEPQVVFVGQEEPERVPGLADWSLCTIRQRGRPDRYGILRRPRPFQQRRPNAPQPVQQRRTSAPQRAKQQDVLALINELFEKPLEQSPPSSPSAVTMASSSAVTMSSSSAVTMSSPSAVTMSSASAVTMSSPSAVTLSSPSSLPSSPSSSPPPLPPKNQTLPKPKLLPKPEVLPEPQPRPRLNKPVVICRRKHRTKNLTIESDSEKPPARSGFLKPLCVPPMMAPPPPVPPRMVPFPPVPRLPQPSTSSDAATVENSTHGITVDTECQTGEGSDHKQKGRCKKRDGKKCERAANQPQEDDGDGSETDDHHGCGMRCARFTAQCMGCTIS